MVQHVEGMWVYSKHDLSDSKNHQLLLSLRNLSKMFQVKNKTLDGNLERLLEKVVRVKLHCFLIREFTRHIVNCSLIQTIFVFYKDRSNLHKRRI